MVDILFQIGAAKLVVSLLLAGVAWAVQRRVGHPGVAHRLWLLVLVALLLPAVVAVPVLPTEPWLAATTADGTVSVNAAATGNTAVRRAVGPTGFEGPGAAALLSGHLLDSGKAGIGVVWLGVAALILAWTLVRALRFRHWLTRTLQSAPPELRDEIVGIGRRLHLTRIPEVHTTTARVSPMVLWTGGRVRLVIPSILVAALDGQELRAVLAHELAHVRRRDHFVRWIEWLACSAFWWNPAAWWARRELRAAEEASCDALGAEALECTPRGYATSLLRVVELLSEPPTPSTPAFATGAVGRRCHGAFERRFQMLISGKTTGHAARRTRVVGVAAASCLLPLGLVYCGFADQPTPTGLEEPLEVAGTTRPVPPAEESRAGSGAPEWEWRWSVRLAPSGVDEADGPGVLVYRVLGSDEENAARPLAVMPGLPAQCQLATDDRSEEARDEPVRACTSALAHHFQSQEDFEGWGVCVSRVHGRVFQCQMWIPGNPDRAAEATASYVWRLQEFFATAPPSKVYKPRRILEE